MSSDIYEYEELVARQRHKTISDIYRYADIATPSGFERTGEFRPPKPGEYFINAEVMQAQQCYVSYGIGAPRLILREKATRKVLVLKTETDIGDSFSLAMAERLVATSPDLWSIEERD